MVTIMIAGRRYTSTGEQANVFNAAFRELQRVSTETGEAGILYQHADQRLAFAAASAMGLTAVFLQRESAA